MSAEIARSCMLCGETDYSVLCEFPELTWVSCRCGLIYKRVEIVPAVEYHEDYFVDRQYHMKNPRRIQKSREQILNVLNHVEPGPLLDVGCARGYALKAGQDLGLAVTGVDVSEAAVGYCSELGYTVKQGLLERLPFDDDAFQIVIVKHVLEHTRTPREALREIRRVLRPGGGLFIAIPHAGYLKARRNPAKSRFYDPNFHGREHYFYYTPDTLTRLLKEESFDPVMVPHPHLVHRRVGLGMRAGEIAVAPLRMAFQQGKALMSLYKEFWVVATR